MSRVEPRHYKDPEPYKERSLLHFSTTYMFLTPGLIYWHMSKLCMLMAIYLYMDLSF